MQNDANVKALTAAIRKAWAAQAGDVAEEIRKPPGEPSEVAASVRERLERIARGEPER